MSDQLMAVPGFPPGSTPTIVAFIMDLSDSMRRFGDEPRTAINAALHELATSPAAPCTAALVASFSDTARIERPLALVANVPPLEELQPNGCTYLYGTVYGVLKPLVLARSAIPSHGGGYRDPSAPSPFHVDLAVFTDGDDNRSTHAQLQKLYRAATLARVYGWNLRVYGYGVDAQEIARRMGFYDDPQSAVSLGTQRGSVHRSTMDFSTASVIFTMSRMRRAPGATPSDGGSDTDRDPVRDSTPTPV